MRRKPTSHVYCDTVTGRVSEWHRCGTFRRVVVYVDVTSIPGWKRGDRVKCEVQMTRMKEVPDASRD